MYFIIFITIIATVAVFSEYYKEKVTQEYKEEEEKRKNEKL